MRCNRSIRLIPLTRLRWSLLCILPGYVQTASPSVAQSTSVDQQGLVLYSIQGRQIPGYANNTTPASKLCAYGVVFPFTNPLDHKSSQTEQSDVLPRVALLCASCADQEPFEVTSTVSDEAETIESRFNPYRCL